MTLPEGFRRRMKAVLGPEADGFFEALAQPAPPTALRINPLRAGVKLPWKLEPVPWCPEGLFVPEGIRPGLDPLHDAGAYYLQEASAMAVGTAARVRPGMRVLDLCAAPGGKAGQMGAALAGEGILVANEVMADRAKILSLQLERLGVAEAAVTNERPDRLAEHFGAVFDRVLVDAPCSGEGMFRKDPEALAAWDDGVNEACARRQRLILESAAALVRPGGLLIYSTCTFSPQENEENAAWFLGSFPDYRADAVSLPGWEHGIHGETGCARLWPHRGRGEGHFIACFRRISGEEAGWEPAARPGRDKRADGFWREWMLGAPPETTTGQGEFVWRRPIQEPEWGKLRVIRSGIPLGRLTRGYFHPHHSLAMTYPGRADLELSQDERLALYLEGLEIPADGQGWRRVTVLGCPLGWGKVSQGKMKNHLPAGLRRRWQPKEERS